MLTPAELMGLKSVLKFVEDSDLFNLRDTITKKMVHATNREDSIEAILSTIQKPSDVLKRQKLTRKVLFNYLLEQKGSASPDCSKIDLITMCLDLWKSTVTTQEMDCIESVVEINCNSNLKLMGLEFVKWFFPLFNKLENFGTEHFWLDCKLDVKVISEPLSREIEIIGDKDVVKFLSSLIINDKFYFHPGTGSEVEQDPHGLVKITVPGVVYQVDNCIGLFDAVFGLVRNPAYENNWKIKGVYMHVKIANNGVSPLNNYHSILP